MRAPSIRELRAGLLATARALAEALLVLVVLATIAFLALRILPGDPAALVLGDHASEVERAALRSKLHLDEPMWLQYARFLRGLATLDLGDSLRRPGASAFGRVAEALVPTATLAATSVGFGTLFGVVAAMLAVGPWLGARRVWVERMLEGLAATPLLSFAPLLTYLLAVRFRLVPLPADPDAGVAGLLFASALLAVPLGAHVGRTTRAALARIRRAPFLAVAVAKGLSPIRVWGLHALPTVSGPVLTVVATQLGALLGGAVVLERLFERPGLGLLVLEAYTTRDVPVLEAAIVAGGAMFVLAQGAATILHATIDPRVSSS